MILHTKLLVVKRDTGLPAPKGDESVDIEPQLASGEAGLDNISKYAHQTTRRFTCIHKPIHRTQDI